MNRRGLKPAENGGYLFLWLNKEIPEMKGVVKKKRQFISEQNEMCREIARWRSSQEEFLETKESLEKFTKAFMQNPTPMGINTLDEGRFIEVNDAFLNLMGLKRSEVIGNTSIELGLITKEQRSSVYDELSKKGKVENLELKVMRKDGSLVNGLFNSVMMNMGKEKYLLSVMTDITKQRLIEETLRKSEEKNRFLLSNTSDYVARYSLTGTLLFGSDAMYRMIGYNPEEIIGTSGFDRMHPDDRHRMQAELEKAIESGMDHKGEYRAICKDGGRKWVEMSAKVVHNDVTGQSEIIAVVRDISDRKEEEVKKNESEAKFRAIYEGSHDAIMLFGNDRFVDCNDRTLEMFDVKSREDFCKLNPADLSPPVQADGQDSKSAARGQIQKAYQQGSNHFEWVHRRFNGEDFYAEVLLSSFSYGGEVILQATVRDITERKRLEKKSKDTLHFLQTLFNTIPSPIFCKDIDGRYVDCNKEFEEYIGVHRKDIIGKSVYQLHPRDVADKYHEMDLALFSEPGRQIYEYPIIYSDGNKHDVVVNKATYQNAEGAIVGLVGVMVDITERKRAEEKLMISEQKYREVFEYVPVGLYHFSADGRTFLEANNQAAKNVGYESPEDLMQSITDIGALIYQNPESIEETLRLINETGSIERYEVKCRHKDGRQVLLSTNIRAVKDGTGKVLYYEGTSEDITELKTAEEELANYRKGLEKIVNIQTHELKEKTKNLEETNITLKVLLSHQEEKRRDDEERFVLNINDQILPFVEKLKSTNLDEGQRVYLNIIEERLGEIASLMRKKFNQFNLTPMEVEVASLVREGRATKDIAKIIGIAASSVNTYRNNIRRKLGINNVKANLQSHLRSFE